MGFDFYAKLAWTGIRKNKRLNLPFIVTCAGMIMMYYIISFLSQSPLLQHIKGGDTLGMMLMLGRWVIGAFSLIFLFYTNSFLVRRRKKEFGLYNILGMGKGSIGKILCWETLIMFCASFSAGAAAGIAFSKFAELGLVNIMRGEVSFALTVSWPAILQALVLFSAIFALILLNTLRQIHASNPIALLRSENTGEKPPRGNLLLGAAGAVLLCVAYYIALSIKEPLAALAWFFIAVILVIFATYLLFITGSVVLCRSLQKKKNYYYQPSHFVSVSSMVYRMKRNGAGLASICILGTMVLVMLSSTACLYFGAEESLRTRYPRDIAVDVSLDFRDEAMFEKLDGLRQSIDNAVADNQLEGLRVTDYRRADVTGLIPQGHIKADAGAGSFLVPDGIDDFRAYLVPAEDYNQLTQGNIVLADDEALVSADRAEYHGDTVTLSDIISLRVKEAREGFVGNGNEAVYSRPAVYIVIADFDSKLSRLSGLPLTDAQQTGNFHWHYAFDLEADDEAQAAVYERIRENLRGLKTTWQNAAFSYSVSGISAERAMFYGTYGSLFFLGIMLSIVFIFAAVLIVYYKQISEGFEDRSRFEIMQKVGMTKKGIRKSINSQLLTVFYLPLLAAGLHLIFAFPMILKMLMLFDLLNQQFLVIVTIISFSIFAMLYALVYRLTSNAYYAIVN